LEPGGSLPHSQEEGGGGGRRREEVVLEEEMVVVVEEGGGGGGGGVVVVVAVMPSSIANASHIFRFPTLKQWHQSTKLNGVASHLNLCALQDEFPQRVVHVTREHMVGRVVDVEPQCTQTVLVCARRASWAAG
jgi:hypothetical protein